MIKKKKVRHGMRRQKCDLLLFLLRFSLSS